MFLISSNMGLVGLDLRLTGLDFFFLLRHPFPPANILLNLT